MAMAAVLLWPRFASAQNAGQPANAPAAPAAADASTPPAPSAKKANPCADDIAKFCKDVAKGKGLIGKCLDQNSADLSDVCKESRAKSLKTEAMLTERMQKAQAACKDDITKFCADVKPGEGRIGDCLKGHKDDLSADCKKVAGRVDPTMHEMKQRYNAGEKMRAACKADVEKFCKDVKPGEGGGIGACLTSHEADLSDDCKAARAKRTSAAPSTPAAMPTAAPMAAPAPAPAAPNPAATPLK